MTIPGRLIPLAALVLLLAAPGFRQAVSAAAVKPLEIFSENILVNEIEHLASEHNLASAQLGKAMERLNKEMNIMSLERIQASLKLIDRVTEALSRAAQSSAALSKYLQTNSQRLKEAGHGRYLPLARMNEETEIPYHKSLRVFLAAAADFVTYCGANLDAISTGQKAENKRYDELYAAYLKTLERFNDQSVKRSQLLAELGTEYPALWELMPK